MPDPVSHSEPLRAREEPLHTREPRGRPWMWIIAALVALLLILWVAIGGTDGDLAGPEAIDAPAATADQPLAEDTAPVAAD
ncbi:hypothetical protein [Marinovum sp.]|uniref:hypothetical protein n=1 Tax=Marinovum sp. TaxID=2024839 RepID=UPI002B27108C|nr:hypothetical protein [Marinovum sp.]